MLVTQIGSTKGCPREASVPACSKALSHRIWSLAQSWDSPLFAQSLCSQVWDAFSSPSNPECLLLRKCQALLIYPPLCAAKQKKIKKVVFLFRDPVIRACYIISGLRQKKEIYADPQANLCRKEFLQLLFSSRLYLCANYQEFVFWRVKAAPSKPADIVLSREKSSLPMQGAEPAPEQRTLDPSLVPRKQKEIWVFFSDALHKASSN